MDAFETQRTFATDLDMVDVSEGQASWLFMIDRAHAHACSASAAEQFLALRAVLVDAASQDAQVARVD